MDVYHQHHHHSLNLHQHNHQHDHDLEVGHHLLLPGQGARVLPELASNLTEQRSSCSSAKKSRDHDFDEGDFDEDDDDEEDFDEDGDDSNLV